MSSYPRPRRFEDFRIAIICALPREYDAAILAFDEIWNDDGNGYEPALRQHSNHMLGRIGVHNVVLVLLPNMGKVSAANETARLQSTYAGLELAILTGICGGVPSPGTEKEVLLGDVVISESIVQYDLGRQYPSKFSRKDTVDDNLGRPNKNIRILLTVLETQLGLNEMQRELNQGLAQIRQKAIDAKYRCCYDRPAAEEDMLFEPDYPHKHRNQSYCGCGVSTTCDEAISASCEDLQCDHRRQVFRKRLESKRKRELGEEGGIANIHESRIHIGCIGSGDTVMKSGEHRDRVAAEHGIVAFEMESAGVWDEFPCIIVKGVCDYADSHKHKKWQNFAAATAASATKALLQRYPREKKFRVISAGCK
ncbi:uncharacterized protein ColSpa_03838 [Colletotrichum spaethianum]|uniref:Nucleoside phosphorylase domain-containing protein n=1 Tax=Colletotrichum spaethianum TaxID=700344 RepID=A0AA37NVV6_9PEZI|nr:uncharacterized protein ColSpa_03838 [Colletotrichum spaethianum]GKT43657.1 hypothetical protein ColSpa_03838 [Colletotrichum spaethianum]